MHRIEERGVPEYEKPRLDKFGTFRELTRAGGNAYADVFLTDSNDGCVLSNSGTICTSYRP